MLSSLRHWSKTVLARLPATLPTSCALCGCDHGEALCGECHARHFARARQRCRRCAIPLAAGTADSCGDCLKNPPAFDDTIVATDYAPPVDQLVLALKFGHRLELAGLLARMLHTAAANAVLPERLTAVPLGPQRLAARGFNQALEIAKPLSRTLGVELDVPMVMRQRDTHAQSLLHPDERRQNIRKAFLVPGDAIDRVRGRHVGVVDDVMTTGETLNELAATLKRFGAARVTNFVFARTDQR
jgi:ComF family protein